MSAFDVLAAAGGSRISPSIVIEASVPLELSGEAVRGRICVFTDEDGREWALRPDMTLPVALSEIEIRQSGLGGARLRYYQGPVFRLPTRDDEPLEFEQIGIEQFGGLSDAETDVVIFGKICQACKAEDVTVGQVQLGDLSVFPAFVDALGLSPETSSGLKRAFRQQGGVRAFLSAERGAGSGLAQRMSGMSRDEAAAFVEDIFSLTGIQPVGERTGDEIVERLHARASSSLDIDISAAQRGILEAVLAVDAPATEALSALEKIASDAKLDQAIAGLNVIKVRHDAMHKSAPDFMKSARFATRFGRRFTYYDGFVFEISSGETQMSNTRPFAAGGRYDSLLSDLSGGAVEASAIGGVIMPHRFPVGKGEPT